MKQSLIFIFLFLMLSACSMELDSLGTSDYNTLEYLAFEEQESEVQINTETHEIHVSLPEPPQGRKTWDSVEIAALGFSRFATIHQVVGRVKSFPESQEKLDSLASAVNFKEESVCVGDRIAIPSTHEVYWVVVAESGKKSIWHVAFDIPGVEPEPVESEPESKGTKDSSKTEKSSSSSRTDKNTDEKPDESDDDGDEKDDGEGDSSDENEKSSSSAEDDFFESSSSSVKVALDSNVSFSLHFVKGAEPEIHHDTLIVWFPAAVNLDSVEVDTTYDVVYRKSSVDVDPLSVKDWKQPQKFEVTAENGQKKTWMVIVKRKPYNETDFQLLFKNQFSAPRSNDTIYVKLNQDEMLKTATLEKFMISEGAKISPNPDSVVWTDVQQFKVTAENDDVRVWTVLLEIAEPDEEPPSTENELKSLMASDEIEKATIDADLRTVTVHLASEDALSKVSLDYSISDKASCSLQKTLDLRSPVTFSVVAEDGVSVAQWTISADYRKSKAAEITSFILDQAANGFAAKTSIHKDSREVTFDVEYRNRDALRSLKFDLEVSAKAKASAVSALALSGRESPEGYRASAEITVTAEDGTEVVWTVVANVRAASSEALLKIRLNDSKNGFSGEDFKVDSAAREVSFVVRQGTNLSKVYFDAVCSPYATLQDFSGSLNLSSLEASVVVVAENGTSSVWTVHVTERELAEKPEILSLKIENKIAILDEDHFHVDSLVFLADLTNLKVTELELSKGASCDIEKGKTYDFSDRRKVIVTNVDGEKKTYTIKAGYQLPGSDFNKWNGNNPMPDSIWKNANAAMETVSKYEKSSLVGAKLETGEILSKIASGSIYTADFNPNKVSLLSMASGKTWPDGNELIDFGRKFNARPEYVEFRVSYAGKGDSCDIYFILENRTGDKNVKRTSKDVNKLVASAWYRSTSIEKASRSNPDVVSVSEADDQGMRTLRLKLTYGKPLNGSPIEESSVFASGLKSKSSLAIDNSLIQGAGTEPVTHVRAVMASSAGGNFYRGVKGATLIIDEMRLIY